MPKIKKKARVDSAALTESFSKNLLGLKFMQRAQNRTDRSQDEDYFSDDLVDDDDHELTKDEKTKRCLFNPSYVFCERLRFGRFSFQGMNLDVEALMFNNSESNTSHKDNGNVSKSSSTGGGRKRPAPSSSSSSDISASGGEELDENEE